MLEIARVLAEQGHVYGYATIKRKAHKVDLVKPSEAYQATGIQGCQTCRRA